MTVSVQAQNLFFLLPLVQEFYKRCPNCPGTPEQALKLMMMAAKFPQTDIMVEYENGEPIGYAWAEVTPDKSYHIHQICMLPGRRGQAMWDGLVAAATEKKCHQMVGISYLPPDAVKALARRYEAEQVAIVLRKKLKASEPEPEKEKRSPLWTPGSH